MTTIYELKIMPTSVSLTPISQNGIECPLRIEAELTNRELDILQDLLKSVIQRIRYTTEHLKQ